MPSTSGSQFDIRRHILPVIAASRVDSIVSLYFEKTGEAQDAFPAIQVVESWWREFSGLGNDADLRRAARPMVDRLVSAAVHSTNPWGVAVAAALGSIRGLIDLPEGDVNSRSVAMGSALTVALEFDRSGLTPPSGWATWFAFEAAGQVAAAEQILSMDVQLSSADLFKFRMEAGMDAMHYHRAMKSWGQ